MIKHVLSMCALAILSASNGAQVSNMPPQVQARDRKSVV